MSNFYAGVGSRSTSKHVCELMSDIAKYLENEGYILRSGGAEGADKAFEGGVKYNKEIYLPDDSLPLWTDVFVDFFHPAPQRLKPFPRRLMRRNAMQVLGRDGDSPVEFVICWTKDGGATGGTAQSMRIAHYFSIPIYNLYYDDVYDSLKGVICETD